jgi:hypothetical protein
MQVCIKNLTDNINAVVRKCEIPIEIMTYLKHTRWGADPIILSRLYRVLMRSRMVHAALAFGKLQKKQSHENKKIQCRQYAGHCATGVHTNNK